MLKFRQSAIFAPGTGTGTAPDPAPYLFLSSLWKQEQEQVLGAVPVPGSGKKVPGILFTFYSLDRNLLANLVYVTMVEKVKLEQ